MAKPLGIDAIRKSSTKYIFNLKGQMDLGIVNPEIIIMKIVFKIFCSLELLMV